MPMTPLHFKVPTIADCAADLHGRQLRTELEYYKWLSLDLARTLEGVGEALAAGHPVSITLGNRPAVRAVRKRGKA